MAFLTPSSRVFITSIKLFFLIALIFVAIPATKCADGVLVRTSRAVYYAGEPVTIIFQSSHPPDIAGTARIIVSGPAGTATAGTTTVFGGVIYSYTLSGSFISIPGYYTVRAVIDIVVETYEGVPRFKWFQELLLISLFQFPLQA